MLFCGIVYYCYKCIMSTAQSHTAENRYQPGIKAVNPAQYINVLRDYIAGENINFRPEVVLQITRKAIESMDCDTTKLTEEVDELEESVRKKTIADNIR